MTSSPTTMRAVRLSAPGPVDNLRLATVPLPPERDGWVRIRVEAFGLNRSELKLRLGLSVGVSFPRVPGMLTEHGSAPSAPAGRARRRELLPARDAALDLSARRPCPIRCAGATRDGLLRRQLSNQWTVRDFSPNDTCPRAYAAYTSRRRLSQAQSPSTPTLPFPGTRHDGLEQVLRPTRWCRPPPRSLRHRPPAWHAEESAPGFTVRCDE